MASRQHVHDQAQSIAAKTDQAGRQHRARVRQHDPIAKAIVRLTAPPGPDFGDLEWIASRHLARQVIVDGTAQAGAHDRQAAPWHAQHWNLLPGQRGAGNDDEQHADENAAVEIFLEDEPGQHGGQPPFHIEQQRGRRDRRQGQPDHH